MDKVQTYRHLNQREHVRVNRRVCIHKPVMIVAGVCTGFGVVGAVSNVLVAVNRAGQVWFVNILKHYQVGTMLPVSPELK